MNLRNRIERIFIVCGLFILGILLLASAGVFGYYRGICYALNHVQVIPIDERVALIDIDETVLPFMK